MACSAPVVASATGGILEVVVDGETGWLVPFDQDPVTRFPSQPDAFARALADRIADLLADPDKARRFGQAGRRRVEETLRVVGHCRSDHRALSRADSKNGKQ